MREIADFERESAGMIFRDDGPESRSEMVAILARDRSALVALRETINCS
jgi:hypothetical protein